MPNVNFRCECGQMLAVADKYLGAQVRCPHCQKIVTAPTSLPAPEPPPMPPTIAPSAPPAFDLKQDEHESIFTKPSADDDVFGNSAARIEMPNTEQNVPIPSAMPRMEILHDTAQLPPTMPPTGYEGTLTYVPPPPAADQTVTTAPPEPPPAPLPWQYQGATDAPEPTTGEQASEPAPLFERESAAASVPPARRGRSPWFDVLFYSLISYSLGVTVLVLWQYFRYKDAQNVERPHPLEFLPDIKGEFPKGKPVMPVPGVSHNLPPRLIVNLGQKLELGELEVTPVRVERGTIAIHEGDPGSNTAIQGAWKLRLHLKNVSPDFAFHPLDRYFTRFWGFQVEKKRLDNKFPGLVADAPYSFLQIGRERFSGGPASYFDERTIPVKERGKFANEHIIGQNLGKELKPGESMESFICNDPEDERLADALKKYGKETFIWRVQVRRGSVLVSGRRIPCTAVFAVQFKQEDIKDEDDKAKPQG